MVDSTGGFEGNPPERGQATRHIGDRRCAADELLLDHGDTVRVEEAIEPMSGVGDHQELRASQFRGDTARPRWAGCWVVRAGQQEYRNGRGDDRSETGRERRGRPQGTGANLIADSRVSEKGPRAQPIDSTAIDPPNIFAA